MAEANGTRECVVCGALFARFKTKAVCSDACAATRQRAYQATSNARKAKLARQCAWCKAEFVIGELTGTKYCSSLHSDLAKKARDKARKQDAEKKREWAREWRLRNIHAVRTKGAARMRTKRAVNGRPDRSKEYDAKRAKRLRPIAAALLWIDTTYHLAHIEALAMNAEFDRAVRGLAKVGRIKFESSAEEFRWKYRNDPIFRQAQIQRTRAQKLKRKKLMSGALTSKDAASVCAERSSCLYCGCHLEDADKVLDHMDPLSKGGAHDISNLVVACKKCNTRKAAKEFIQWLPLVAEGRRKLVADWYARKHGAQPEQIGLRLFMAA